MDLGRLRWTWTDPDGSGWARADPDGPERAWTDPDGPERTRMDLDGPGWTQTDPDVLDGPRQIQTYWTDPDRLLDFTGLVPLGSAGFRWVPLVSAILTYLMTGS